MLTGLAALALAAAALRYSLRGLEWHAFRAQLRGLDLRWLALAVLFDISSYLAQGWRWRSLLDGANLWLTTRAIYAGLFLNELIPFRPGEAVRAWLAARDLHRGVLEVTPTLLTERLMDGVWLAVALVGALLLAPLPETMVRIAWPVIAAAFALSAAAWLLGRTRFGLFRRIRTGLANAPAWIASGAFLASQGMAFWAVVRAGHLSLGMRAAFVVMAVVRLGTLIPLAPANLGTHQLAAVLGLTLFGVAPPQAAGVALVLFAVLTLPLLVLGCAASLSAGLTWQGIRQEALPRGRYAGHHEPCPMPRPGTDSLRRRCAQ